MEVLRSIYGTVAPLPRSHVDTDQIMPKQFLKRISREGFGEFIFADWRKDAAGKVDPDLFLNRPEFQDARILATGTNFGTGSSREHAVWGLKDWGFDAIIAPSFADIFRNNCGKVGLLAIELEEAVVVEFIRTAEMNPGFTLSIDVDAQSIESEIPINGESTIWFDMDAFLKYRFINGLDDIDLTLKSESLIEQFERERRPLFPEVV